MNESPNQSTDSPTIFSTIEVQTLNIDAWNAAVSKCQQIINQVADDYLELKVGAVARQLRCVSMLLDDARRMPVVRSVSYE